MTNIDLPKMPKDNADRRMNFAGRNEIAEKLSSIPGHPLYTFVKENEVLRKLLADAVAAAQSMAVTTEQLEKIRWLSMVHYAKKGDLLYPHLKAKYEVTGPSDVMWTDDDTLRDGWNLLRKFSDYDDRWYKKFLELAGSAENMIKKRSRSCFLSVRRFLQRKNGHLSIGMPRIMKMFPKSMWRNGVKRRS